MGILPPGARSLFLLLSGQAPCSGAACPADILLLGGTGLCPCDKNKGEAGEKNQTQFVFCYNSYQANTEHCTFAVKALQR